MAFGLWVSSSRCHPGRWGTQGLGHAFPRALLAMGTPFSLLPPRTSTEAVQPVGPSPTVWSCPWTQRLAGPTLGPACRGCKGGVLMNIRWVNECKK